MRVARKTFGSLGHPTAFGREPISSCRRPAGRGDQTPSTAVLTGLEPTGMTAKSGADRVRRGTTSAIRITAIFPDPRLRTSAYWLSGVTETWPGSPPTVTTAI